MSSQYVESRYQAPLNDQELEQVRRLFSDPFAIPFEFKAWLIAYLEANPPLLPAGTIFGLHGSISSALDAVVVPGMIMQYGGTTDPNSHWMICNNRLLDRTTYADLFANIGFAYSPTPGADPGSNQFYIPDGPGRSLVGLGTHVDVNALGKTEGVATVANRTPKHNSTKAGAATLTGSNSSLSLGGSNSSITLSGYTAVTAASGGGVGFTGGDRFIAENFGLGGANSSLFLSGSNSSLGLSDTISVGPGGTRPVDTGAFLVVNHIIYVG